MPFSLGDLIKAPTSELAGVDFIVGSVVYCNSRFFVVRSAVSGFTTAYTWLQAASNPYVFKKVSICEARELLAGRLYGRELNL